MTPMNDQEAANQDSGKKYLFVAVFFIALIIAGGIFVTNKKEKTKEPLQSTSPSATIAANAVPEASATPSASPIMNVTKLEIKDEKVGTGEAATVGKKVTVNYLGTLTDGTKFDSSYDRGTPFSFTLGAGEVIEGWDKGVVGMKIGGKRKLIIPSSMAYGDSGISGVIPGGATLVFEVELLKVE